LQKKYWAKVHADPFYKKNVFEDAVQIFGGEQRVIRMPLETGDLSAEQCENIARFMLYADGEAAGVQDLAREIKKIGEVGLEYGFLFLNKRK